MREALRRPTEADLPEVVRLMSSNWPEPMDEEGVRRMWTDPRVDVERDVRLEPGSYATVEDLGEGRVWIDLRGSPSEKMIDWAEARAREVGKRVLAGAWSSHEELLCELARRGFDRVRSSYRMTIDLTQATPDPIWPNGIAVRTFEPGDERLFYEVEQETFADTWEPEAETFEEWSHWMLHPPAFAPDLWFLAEAGDEVAGIAICHPRFEAGSVGWVRVLGVRGPWRKAGVGRALLLHAFAEFRRRRLTAGGLGVDAESLTGAHRLYESVGMHVAARFDICEKAAG